jgi:hypothetical protein
MKRFKPCEDLLRLVPAVLIKDTHSQNAPRIRPDERHCRKVTCLDLAPAAVAAGPYVVHRGYQRF